MTKTSAQFDMVRACIGAAVKQYGIPERLCVMPSRVFGLNTVGIAPFTAGPKATDKLFLRLPEDFPCR